MQAEKEGRKAPMQVKKGEDGLVFASGGEGGGDRCSARSVGGQWTVALASRMRELDGDGWTVVKADEADGLKAKASADAAEREGIGVIDKVTPGRLSGSCSCSMRRRRRLHR